MCGLVFIASMVWKQGDLYMMGPCAMLAVLPMALLLLRREAGREGRWRRLQFPLCLFLAGALLGTSHFIRSHSGTSAALFIVTAIWLMGAIRWRRKTVLTTALLAGTLIPAVFFSFQLNRRDLVLAQLNPDYLPSARQHPLWHSVYCGLGYLQNGYGFQWYDGTAIERVRRDAPEAAFCSKEYEATLRTAVFDLYRTDSAFVVRTVFAKVGMLLFFLLRYASLGIVCLGLLKGRRNLQVAFVVAIAFESLFSIIALPAGGYVLGFCSMAILAAVMSLAQLIDDCDDAEPFWPYFWTTCALLALPYAWTRGGFLTLLPVFAFVCIYPFFVRYLPVLKDWIGRFDLSLRQRLRVHAHRAFIILAVAISVWVAAHLERNIEISFHKSADPDLQIRDYNAKRPPAAITL